ncbi:hypothetical protein BJX64DRAFT_201814 [Aspergillus heterothallicus]
MASIAAKTSIFEPTVPFSRAPSSPEQWKQALQEVKLLYIRRQYKRCVARSSSILSSAREPIHPIHKVYLYFYAAICYEAMGRYAHDYSRNKILLLHSALESFVTCLAILPDKLQVDEDLLNLEERHLRGLDVEIEYTLLGFSSRQKAGELQAEIESFSASISSRGTSFLSPSPSPLSSAASRSTSPTESIVSSITDIIDKTLCCPEDDPFLSDSDDPDDCENIVASKDRVLVRKPPLLLSNPPKNEIRLMPSPLHVRKSCQPLPLILPLLDTDENSSVKCKAQKQLNRRSRPFSIPLPIKLTLNPTTEEELNRKSSCDYTSPSQLNPTSMPLSAYSLPAQRIHTTFSSARKYNSTIVFLHTQITSSIASLHDTINSTKALQQSRAASRQSLGLQRSVSFWSFSPVKRGCANSSHGPGNEDGIGASPVTAVSKRASMFASGYSASISTLSSSRRHGHENIQDRIARLQAEGWDTVGLKNQARGWKGAEYYRGFCGAALDDLYLDS